MNLKRTALAAAVAGTLAMGLSGTASAYVYGASGLSIDGLTIAITPFANATIDSFNFTQTDTSTLNSAPGVNGTASCSGTPGPGGVTNNCTPAIGSLDANSSNAPGGTLTRPNNSTTGGEFTFFGPLTGFTGQYSNSDSQIVTAALVDLGTPTSTRQVAESLLSTGTNAAASSEIQSTTGFTFTFTTQAPGTFSLNFLADPDLFAQIFGEPLNVIANSQANISVGFTLSQQSGGTSRITWAPSGTFGGVGTNDCVTNGAANTAGIVCAETADSQNLNTQVGVHTNATDSSSWDPNSLNETPFGITITGLTAGTWTLTLDARTSDSLTRRVTTVPEPGTLAALGAGLLGLFAAGRRKNRG